MERDLWILLQSASPKQAAVLLADKRDAMGDPEFRAIYLKYDAAFDWSPDDPRLYALAARAERWLAKRHAHGRCRTPAGSFRSASLGWPEKRQVLPFYLMGGSPNGLPKSRTGSESRASTATMIAAIQNLRFRPTCQGSFNTFLSSSTRSACDGPLAPLSIATLSCAVNQNSSRFTAPPPSMRESIALSRITYKNCCMKLRKGRPSHVGALRRSFTLAASPAVRPSRPGCSRNAHERPRCTPR
jgi:hypothetical protein